MWDPKQYQRFSNERSRPFFDLVSQIKLENADFIVDLGCGDGILTRSLLHYWPNAKIQGIDSSENMIKEATKQTDQNLNFQLANITDWENDEQLDLIISNAVFQWIPDHNSLLTRLIGFLKQKSVFAFQIPGNFDQPTHTILAKICTNERWNVKLGKRKNHILQTDEYIRLFSGFGFEVNAWETTYFHILPGDNAVLEWVKGTALRPILSKLDINEQKEFLDEYNNALLAVYPQQNFGTILPFKRIFIVAKRN